MNLRYPGHSRVRLLVTLVVVAVAVVGALAANALGSFTGTVTPATDCPAGSLNSHVTGFTAPGGTGGGSGNTFYVHTSSVNIDFCANGAGLAAAQLQEKAVANGASSYSTAQTILAPTPSTTASGTFTGISLTTDGEYDFYTVALSSAPAQEAAPAGPDLTIILDTVGPTAPTITPASEPALKTNSTSANFAFTAAEGGGTMSCKLDGAATGPCDSTTSQSYSGLADGSHTFSVIQTDAAQNAGTAATYTWTVDTVAPVVGINQFAAPGSRTSATMPMLSGAAGTATGDMNTVAAKVYSGTLTTQSAVDAATPIRTFSSAVSMASWSIAQPDWVSQSQAALPQGDYTVEASQSDGANTGFSPIRNFTVDTTGPSTTIATDTPPNLTNDATPNLHGTAGNAIGDSSTITVDIYSGPAAVDQMKKETLLATRSGTGWTLTDGDWASGTALTPDGQYTAKATQTDSAGNTGTAATRTFMLDATAPAVTMTAPAAATNDTTPNLSGNAGSASGDSTTVTINIYAGPSVSGGPVRTIQETATGTTTKTWSIANGDYVPALTDGTFTAQASQTDTAGNTGFSMPRTFVVDTVNPAAPAITNASKPADPTNATSGTLEFTGVEPGATANCTLDGNTTACTSSSTDNYAMLVQGSHTFTVSQTDAAGNTSPAAPEATYTWTVDTAAPSVGLASPANNSSTDATPDLSGAAGNASGDSNTVTVRVYAGGSATGDAVATYTPTRSGATWAVTADALSDGIYTAQASQTDTAGNTGQSSANTFHVISGVHTLATSPTYRKDTMQFPFAYVIEDGAGNEISPAQGGVAKVQLWAALPGSNSFSLVSTDDPTMKASPTDSNPQLFTYTPAAGDGSYRFFTVALDSGNQPLEVKAAADSTTVVDTVAPAATLDQPADPGNDATPNFTGGAGNAVGDDQTITVEIWSGSAAVPANSPQFTLHATRTTTTWTLTDNDWGANVLPDGTWTAEAIQTDAAGNSTTTAPRTFSTDTVVPVVTLTAITGPTKDTTPNYQGTAGGATGDSSTVTLKIYEGVTPTGSPVRTIAAPTTGTVSKTWGPVVDGDYTSPLPDGTYTSQASQTDTAGNVGLSSPQTIVVDTTPPAVTLTQPATPSNDTTPNLTGDAGNAAGDTTGVTVKVFSGSAATGSPIRTINVTRTDATWALQNGDWTTPLAEGTYTAQASQPDSATNGGQSAARTFTIDTTAPGNAPVLGTKPPALSNSRDASFTFTPAENGGTIGCKLDGGSYVPCTSRTSKSYSGLSDGSHMFSVKQTDDADNDSPASTYGWTIDATAPAVTLADVGTTQDKTPNLAGQAGDASGDSKTVTVTVYAGSAATGSPIRTFALARSGGSWALQDGDWTTPLTDGTYTAQASQSDAVGNTGTSDARTFTVTTPSAPTPGTGTGPGTGPVTTPPPPPTPPTPPTVTLVRTKLGSFLTTGLRVRIGNIPAPTVVAVTISVPAAAGTHAGAGSLVVARKRATDFSGGTLTVKVGRATAKKLARLRTLRLTVRVAEAQTAGPALITTKRITLTR